MTRTVAIGKHDSIHLLPSPKGAILWWQLQRVELDQYELSALANAFAEMTTPQEAVSA